MIISVLCFAVWADFSYPASRVYSLQLLRKCVASEKAVHPQLSVNPRLVICIPVSSRSCFLPLAGDLELEAGQESEGADKSNVHSPGRRATQEPGRF